MEVERLRGLRPSPLILRSAVNLKGTAGGGGEGVKVASFVRACFVYVAVKQMKLIMCDDFKLALYLERFCSSSKARTPDQMHGNNAASLVGTLRWSYFITLHAFKRPTSPNTAGDLRVKGDKRLFLRRHNGFLTSEIRPS